MSDSDLTSQFAALSDVAARLNAQSDTVTQLIEQFQDKLRALNVGLEAWVLLKSEPGSVVVPGPGPRVRTPRPPAPATPVTMEISVGHARGDEGWGLFVRRIAYKPQPAIFPPATAKSCRSPNGSSWWTRRVPYAWRRSVRSPSCLRR